MNVDSSNSSSRVTSKYFSSKGGMDDSLSDFQEKKKFASTRNSQKVQQPSTSKSKTKKNIKRIRGQKDIRTILKSKKNELITYSNDFDKICKQSGIDVDSEQLQLAIALSKSLQKSEATVEEDSSSSGTLSIQERTGKIRTTLLEYGFVVPEVKITETKRKKNKKHTKNYKLLQTSEAEKQQVIADKYSQVLFKNLEYTKNNNTDNCSNNFAPLFHLVTNTAYEKLKDNNLLYVEGLFEELPSCVGCLLKDWAEIPGRPLSPTCEDSKINFKSVDYTQEDLDIVLSGSIQCSQEIVKRIHSLLYLDEPAATTIQTTSCIEKEENLKMDFECVEIPEHMEVDSLKSNFRNKMSENNTNSQTGVIDLEVSNLKMTQNIRSCSPDIFDEEVSEIIENCEQITDKISQDITSYNYKTQTNNDIMDLTECFTHSQPANQRPIPMDITKCVVGSSQPIRENFIKENIDLTQNSDSENKAIVNEEKITTKYTDCMDLTQSSDSNADLPVVEISGKGSVDETIILNESSYSVNNFKRDHLLHPINLHCSSSPEKCQNLNNTLVISGKAANVDSENNVDNHTKINIAEGSIGNIQCNTDNKNCAVTTVISPEHSTETITKHPSPNQSEKDDTNSKTVSFFEEFSHRHSDSSSKENTDDILCVDEGSVNSFTNNNSHVTIKCCDIDLTQTTDTSEEANNATERNDSPKIAFISSNLGKIDDVSIDYDEMFDDMVRSHVSTDTQSISSSSKTEVNTENFEKPGPSDLVSNSSRNSDVFEISDISSSSKSHITDMNSENCEKPGPSDLECNSSRNSDVFEISDKELDYSVHKSRLDFDNQNINFDFGGISIVDNLPDLPSFRQSNDNNEINSSLNQSLNDNYLPVVSLNGRNYENDKEANSSQSVSQKLCTAGNEIVTAKTPINGEYIIKTDQVTPMLDYERLTTPERNKELDKFGLKPFKRKRAIQLLTHLYNQTHPIVESLENLPSPSKRFKPNIISEQSPSKTNDTEKKSEVVRFQKKVSKSPRRNKDLEVEGEVEEVDKENGIYEVTSEVPDVRVIECCEDDLVFQKREKAKIHSCRVPLHVAFHNYVFARQRLRESILRYEPVNIDVIHKGLIGDGYKYDPKDLLKFMDKKCITVKTADNNARNKKHY